LNGGLFPDGFLWGTATSALQVEGGAGRDDRGPSIWDTFCATPGKVRGGGDARSAAGHRDRMPEDVGLLAALGVDAYGFSISWPRVQPLGRGRVNHPGLDFYRALADELLAHGIAPVATLYHWDLPQALEDAGGWPSRTTAARFGDFAALVGEALGDRIRRWTTVHEPWCVSMLGYAAGLHAPGRTEPAAAAAAAHHLLLGHGYAVDALRAPVPDAELSITLSRRPVVPAGPSDADLDAARRVDGLANRLWHDAVLRGRYPDDVLSDLQEVTDLRHVRDGDLAVISRPLDALGLSYRGRYHVRHRLGASVGGGAAQWPGSPDVELVEAPAGRTDGARTVDADGLHEALVSVSRDYDPPPLYVHEGGAALDDERTEHDRVEDRRRIAWLEEHLAAARRAVDDGAHLRGCFVWSFLDGFEWAEGYAHRSGLVHVDFATEYRTPKRSARWYAEVIARNALPDRRR
jgi:beta-glucosidase